ncbi:MAG: methyltransferase domain-containing protein [Syntrophales bacterium]
MTNLDRHTVDGFGDEWLRYDQSELSAQELNEIYSQYFNIFPWHLLKAKPIGYDLGCGSGRWAKIVADNVGQLHCIDASDGALNVAKENLREKGNCVFHHNSVDAIPLEDGSMDFGYSLGVLHHVPDTLAGIKSCTAKLKPGAPFLIYLYYAFDNRPFWFVLIWNISNIIRLVVSRLPYFMRYAVTQSIATLVYYPLARAAYFLEKAGFSIESFPLSNYRKLSFYTMRTDALDRFGTRLEQRFTRKQIEKMLRDAGLDKIEFSDSPPYWCALGYKV